MALPVSAAVFLGGCWAATKIKYLRREECQYMDSLGILLSSIFTLGIVHASNMALSYCTTMNANRKSQRKTFHETQLVVGSNAQFFTS